MIHPASVFGKLFAGHRHCVADVAAAGDAAPTIHAVQAALPAAKARYKSTSFVE